MRSGVFLDLCSIVPGDICRRFCWQSMFKLFFHNGLNFLFITCYLDKQIMLDSMYVHLIDKSDSQCFLAAVVVVIVWYLVSNYLCNQCLMLWVLTPLRRGVLDTTLCDKVCQWLATDRWFSPGTPVSSTNTTDCHDITEILLKVA